MTATRLIAATDKLTATCEQLTFGAPITHTYHPLRYARRAHNKYLRQFGDGTKRTLFWGMNPGPWGMTQTGVPFGEVAAVRDWMKICEAPQQQPDTHPARPILGFDCPRSEVSGRRLWDLFAQEYKTAAAFFSDHLVLNYCPLLFLSAEGKRCTNITPDKLSPAEKTPLFEA
jgi:single-strand selective monofunctional uracil DNA glycosylase